jgi:predicted nucleic acid-binding Zn ribbon protein
MAKGKTRAKKPDRLSAGQIMMLIFSLIIVLSVVLSLFAKF